MQTPDRIPDDELETLDFDAVFPPQRMELPNAARTDALLRIERRALAGRAYDRPKAALGAAEIPRLHRPDQPESRLSSREIGLLLRMIEEGFLPNADDPKYIDAVADPLTRRCITSARWVMELTDGDVGTTFRNIAEITGPVARDGNGSGIPLREVPWNRNLDEIPCRKNIIALRISNLECALIDYVLEVGQSGVITKLNEVGQKIGIPEVALERAMSVISFNLPKIAGKEDGQRYIAGMQLRRLAALINLETPTLDGVKAAFDMCFSIIGISDVTLEQFIQRAQESGQHKIPPPVPKDGKSPRRRGRMLVTASKTLGERQK